MSNEPRTPENLPGTDDQALGEALGSAIREQVETPAFPPPVAHIAERAAARAKARNTRRAVVGVAASLAMVAGGIAAWNALDGDQPTEVIVVDEPATTPDPASTVAPIDGPSDTLPEASADRGELGTPEGLPTGPMLEWTEFDPASVFGADLSYVDSLESVGDGRVLVQAGNSDAHQVLVSSNGSDWTVVPMPPEFQAEHIDITGDRWLVTEFPTTMMGESISQAFFSDDQGITWADLDVPLDPEDGYQTASVAAALVSGENMVVAVISRTIPDVASVIVARGLVPDKESIRGWTSVEGDIVSFTRDESSTPESFELTDEEEDFLYGGIQRHIRIYFSDGGPAELAAEYPGWNAAGYGADDGFRLWLTDSDGEWLLTSPDGRQWRRSPLLDGDGSPVGSSYTYSGSHQQTLWTASQTGSGYRVERSEGVYTPALVAKFPAGILWVRQMAVGPAGIAAVGEAGSLPNLDSIPQMRLAKDGYELRYYEPVGGFTLWDLTAGAAAYVFDPAIHSSEIPPPGFRLVEGSEAGPDLLVFDDPDTGAELVTFTQEELESLLAGAYSAPTGGTPEQRVGWSDDGDEWGWQPISAAFGLSGLTEEQKEFTEVDLAVGGDFVIARVRTYEVESSDVVGDEEGGPALQATPHTPRWFVATVE